MHSDLGLDTIVTLLAAGLIFLLAPVLGVWKYRQMATSENHLAHPYVDTTNQFERSGSGLQVGMVALNVGEIGGFAVLFSGFIAAQLF